MGSLGNAIEANFSPAGKEQRSALRQATAYDSYLQGVSKDVIGRATTIADRPYQAYTGQRVAGLSGNEQQGLNLASTEGDQGRDYATKAGNLVGEVAGNDFSGDVVSKYMNPYVKNVVDSDVRNVNLQAATAANQLKGQAASRGAFGGARESLLETQNEKNRLQTVSDVTNKGMSDAYNSAISTWKADNDRKLSAAQAYQSVGNDITKMNSQQVQDLMATGGADRVLSQLKLDTDYSSFIEQRDWSVNNLQPLIQSLGAARGNTSSPYGVPQSQGNTAGQTIGAISAIAGFFGKGSSGYGQGTYTADTGGGGTNVMDQGPGE